VLARITRSDTIGRINSSDLERGGVNRTAKQFQSFLAKVLSDPGTSGKFLGTSGKMHRQCIFQELLGIVPAQDLPWIKC
jgi:hypothetical protein